MDKKIDEATKLKIQNLVAEVNKYNYYYHVLDSPIVSDKDYDKAYYTLLDLEKQTGYILPDSPTQRVGDMVSEGFTKHTHEARLYSLDKAQSPEEMTEWVDKILAQYPNTEFTLEYKFDGLRLALTYDDGILTNASTRGNGSVGEDVTAQVKTIRSVPLSIDFKGHIVVEGEGIMLLSELDNYNKKSDGPLKNARNAVAGAIRNLDPKVTASRNLDFFAYGIPVIVGKSFKTQVELRQFLIDNRFLVGDFFEVRKTPKQIMEVINQIDKQRDVIDILIDGVVIKINEIATRDELGFTIRFPKWALAYKFEALEVTTYIRDVIWQVGRTGKLTPLALLDPVDIAGATIQRATLNNWDDIQRKKVKINSLVFIRRSNEVIPEILGLAQDYPDSKEIKKVEFCPSCNTKLVEVGANIFCPNRENCPGQLKERIIHFCNRDAMNIEGIRDKIVDLLFDKLNIRTVDQLYTLKQSDLEKLENFKDKKSGNIISSIEKSKNIDFANFIFALGINNVGIKTAKDLARKYPDYKSLKDATLADLASIRDIGEVVAKSIYDYFRLPKNMEIIDNLFKQGVTIKYNQNRGGGKFKDKTFVLTGTLPNLTRQQATKLIEDNGGAVSSSVSKNTDFVLAGEATGNKYEKAKMLGIAIINEEEFMSMLNN